MKRLALPLLATVAFQVSPALAAPPSGFLAVGTATSFATAEAPQQATPVKFYYEAGKIRIELRPPSGGPSVVLAKRGSKTVTLLDPTQKIAFTTNAQATAGAAPEGMPSMDQLMDMASWKSQLVHGAKKLPGTEVRGAQRCSVWLKTQGTSTYKIWFADALELPMQIDGAVAGKPRFRFAMSRVTTGKQAPSLFTVPAGYQKTVLNTASLKH